jgi:hypothetical protein
VFCDDHTYTTREEEKEELSRKTPLRHSRAREGKGVEGEEETGLYVRRRQEGNVTELIIIKRHNQGRQAARPAIPLTWNPSQQTTTALRPVYELHKQTLYDDSTLSSQT